MIDENSDTKTEAASDEDFLKEALANFKLVEDAESSYRVTAIEDIKFSIGDQWESNIKTERELDRRPCLTINRLPQFIRQITNDQRQNRPSIKVSPVDSNADVETAKALQGLIRHIEYNSNADVAYDNAFDGAVRAGRGFFRLVTDYVSEDSFNQEILIKQIKNPLGVYFDPMSVEPDGSDAKFAFIPEDLLPEEFKRRYPKSKLASMEDFEVLGDRAPSWISGKSIRISEYYYIKCEDKKLYQLTDGKVVESVDGIDESLIKNSKTASVPTVHWCVINGIEVLERAVIPGKYIPVLPVYGDEIYVDGERIFEGVVRHAKDPQKMYNYWASSETEMIALAPRAPFIGYAGQFEGFEKDWKTANRKNHAYLQVKPIMVNGQPAPLPQRNAYEAPVQAITQARMMSAEDLKSTTGIYDAGLGNKSNESSGIAIQRRANQSQTANFHFIDNLSRSLRHAGRIIVSWIPTIYDTQRAVRIIGEDDSEKVVLINGVFEGQKEEFNFSHGKYDVTISNGPSYQTKRQEAVESMLALASSNQQVMGVAADLMVKNMDWPGADEIAERLKKTLPPGIADDPDNKQPIPPEVQAQMGQMNQMIEQLTAQLNQAQQVVQTKQLELQSREKIEFAKIEADLKKEFLKTQSQEAVALLKTEIEQINKHLETLGMQPESSVGDEMLLEDSYAPQTTFPTGGATSGQILE